MPEDNLPPLQEVPRVESGDWFSGRVMGHVDQVYDQQIPAFVVPEHDEIPRSFAHRHIGGLLVAASYDKRGQHHDLKEEYTMGYKYDTPEHIDGAKAHPYLQVHTNQGPGVAEVIFETRSVSPQAQAEIAAKTHKEIPNLKKNPVQVPIIVGEKFEAPDVKGTIATEAFRLSPIVARHRTILRPGETIVFMNGAGLHEASDSDRLITTHKFHSIDEHGNPIQPDTEGNYPQEHGRKVEASYVTPRKRGLFGRRSS